ncbi:hypothetical protein F4X86_03930 [Candidatus Saccharibacteria bacterium]|nr:hypothetical protein [Candidatus Saccharibacteria bacterium]
MRRLPRTVTNWSYSALEAVPKDAVGLYAFWLRDKKKCVYVGQSTNQTIRQRLRQHWHHSSNEELRDWLRNFGEFLDLCVYPHLGPTERIRRMERALIRKWQPHANRQHAG